MRVERHEIIELMCIDCYNKLCVLFLGKGYTKHLEQSLIILCDKFRVATNAEMLEDVSWAAQGQIPSRFLFQIC